jgi:hypothetical protein
MGVAAGADAGEFTATGAGALAALVVLAEFPPDEQEVTAMERRSPGMSMRHVFIISIGHAHPMKNENRVNKIFSATTQVGQSSRSLVSSYIELNSKHF